MLLSSEHHLCPFYVVPNSSRTLPCIVFGPLFWLDLIKYLPRVSPAQRPNAHYFHDSFGEMVQIMVCANRACLPKKRSCKKRIVCINACISVCMYAHSRIRVYLLKTPSQLTVGSAFRHVWSSRSRGILA